MRVRAGLPDESVSRDNSRYNLSRFMTRILGDLPLELSTLATIVMAWSQHYHDPTILNIFKMSGQLGLIC